MTFSKQSFPNLVRTVSLLAFLLALVVCLNPAAAMEPNSDAKSRNSGRDLQWYYGGKIYTASPKAGFATDMVVLDGEIIAIGTPADAKLKAGRNAERVNLGGRLVIPGIHDSHVHILEANFPLSGTCLVEPGRKPSRLIQTLSSCAPDQAELEWVLGWGWDITSFLNSGENPLSAIDQAIPDRPAAIMEETSHAVWVNSAGLEALGITSQSADPVGGHFARSANGQLNGLLIDNAGDLAFEAALQRTAAVDQQHFIGLLNGLEQLARNGITTFADARVYWTRGYHEFYARAEQEGVLTARAYLGMWGYAQKPDAEQLIALTDLYSRDSSQQVQRSQIKVYIDGITHMTTARVLTPYLIDYGFDTPTGLNYFTEDRLTVYITELERVGYDFHIHAIGAGGVRQALNAIERARAANPEIKARHRITHVEHVHPDDLPRFAQLGVTADIQLAGDWTSPRRFQAATEPFIGANNPALPLPARALIDAGANVSLSSDFDVSPLSPFGGIEHAVDRGSESLTIEEAVNAYTINPAYSMHHEDRIGSLEVGKKADFVVLDRDIFSIPKDQISETEVLLTALEGQTIFRSKRFGCVNRPTRKHPKNGRSNAPNRDPCVSGYVSRPSVIQ